MLTRAEAERIKGAAILLMFVHHLFGLPGLIDPPAGYVGIIPGLPLEYWLGRYGKVCVAVFLFLSGYGLAAKGPEPLRATLRRILRFMGVYWAYFAVFVPIGAVFFGDLLLNGTPRYAITPYRLITSLLTVRTEYNFEWWYAETYLLLLMLAGPLLALATRPLLAIGGSLLAFGVGAALDVARIDTPLVSVSNLLIWQLPFVAGMLGQRAGVEVTARRAAGAAAALLVGFALVEVAVPFAMTPYVLITVPLTMVWLVWAVRHIGRAGEVLAWLGGLSLQLWLVHTFFCYYFAQPFIYAPRLSVLVLANLLLCSLAAVLVIEALRKRALRLIQSR